jgi:oligoendopeptidase F
VNSFCFSPYTQQPPIAFQLQIDEIWSGERFKHFIEVRDPGADAIGWQKLGLLFHTPFYYIEYALAHLGALQLHLKEESDAVSTWQGYRAALAQGDTLPLPELYAKAGARLPLDPQVVNEVARALAKDIAKDLEVRFFHQDSTMESAGDF